MTSGGGSGAPAPGAGLQAGAPAELPRHRHRPPPKHSRWQTVLIALLAVLAAGAGAVVSTSALTANHYSANVARLRHVFPSGPRPAPVAGALTFLVVGGDSRGGSPSGLLPEGMALVRLTSGRTHAEVVSLPVNASLSAPQQPGHSLGGAFSSGGSAQLISAIESATDVRIDHYAQLDFDGVRSVTQQLGGVDVEVQAPYRNRGYSFHVGLQHLAGNAALAYLRNADAAARDTAVVRQQAIITALFERVSQLGLLSDFGRLTDSVGRLSQALTVDNILDGPDLVQLVWSLRDLGRPVFITAPVGGTGVEQEEDVQYLDPSRAGALWSYLRQDSLAEHLDEFRRPG
jgi:LCP family protein required for cell wall assembly